MEHFPNICIISNNGASFRDEYCLVHENALKIQNIKVILINIFEVIAYY